MKMNEARLFVMRHAESQEDVDKTAYERIVDEDMPLTLRGKEQASSFGRLFSAQFFQGQSLKMILSPSRRVLETANGIVTGLADSRITWSLITEKLIVKQSWGNVTIHNRAEIERERYRIGVLRYNFPGGEGGPETLARFGLFAQKLKYEMMSNQIENVLIITHGFEFRLILKSLLGWTEEYFESLAHPKHCELKRLSFDGQTCTLLDQMRVHDPLQNPNFIRREGA